MFLYLYVNNQSWTLICELCHFNRASNDKFSVECWMFVLIFFQPTIKSDLKEVQLTQNYWVKAPLEYLEGAPNFNTQSRLKNITKTNIQNLTLNLSFDALLKWHDPDINLPTFLAVYFSVPKLLFLFTVTSDEKTK